MTEVRVLSIDATFHVHGAHCDAIHTARYRRADRSIWTLTVGSEQDLVEELFTIAGGTRDYYQIFSCVKGLRS